MYITHNEEPIPAEHLNTTGIIQSNYKLLLEMFGEPNVLNSDHLHVEWRLRIGPHIVSITNYIGVTQPKRENVALWPIACTSPGAVHALREILENPIPSMRRKIEIEIAKMKNSCFILLICNTYLLFNSMAMVFRTNKK